MDIQWNVAKNSLLGGHVITPYHNHPLHNDSMMAAQWENMGKLIDSTETKLSPQPQKPRAK
jgi:hypothetical protein